MHEDTSAAPGAQDENQVMAERRSKLAGLRASSVPAFPNDIHPTHRAGPLSDRYDAHSREQLEAEQVSVSLAGRMFL